MWAQHLPGGHAPRDSKVVASRTKGMYQFHLKPAIFRVRKTISPALGPHRLSDAPRPADHSARFSAPQTLAEGRGGRLSFPPGKFVRPRDRSSFVTVCNVRNEVFVRLFGRGAQSDSASHPAPNGPVERKFVPNERNSFPNLTNLSNYEKPSPKTNKAIFFWAPEEIIIWPQ